MKIATWSPINTQNNYLFFLYINLNLWDTVVLLVTIVTVNTYNTYCLTDVQYSDVLVVI
jgi:hypothetical protein